MVDRYWRKIEDVENNIENSMQISSLLLKLKGYDEKLSDLSKIGTNESNIASNLGKIDINKTNISSNLKKINNIENDITIKIKKIFMKKHLLFQICLLIIIVKKLLTYILIQILLQMQLFGGSNPIFAHGKNVSFPIFPHGKKYMEREGNEYFSIYFFFHFFPFSPLAKMELDPPIIKIDANYNYSYDETNNFSHIYKFYNNYQKFKEVKLNHNMISNVVNDKFDIRGVNSTKINLLIYLVNNNKDNKSIVLFDYNAVQVIYNDNIDTLKSDINRSNISSNLEKNI